MMMNFLADNTKIMPAELETFSITACEKAGLQEKDALTTTKVLVTTDTWGVFTHGTKQLRGLVKNLRDGRLKADAVPEIIRESLSSVLIDGHYAMPMVSSVKAMKVAIEKAKKTGIAIAGVYHSGHFGAAGYYANMAANQGMIGVSMCNVEPFMAIPGSRGRVLGTNPIAYAVPAGQYPTIMLDIATSAVAVSKIFAARARNEPIPLGWLLDAAGNSTTDPNNVDEGALLPMAGHKGYGIAVFIEILSAVLTGSAMMSQVQSWALDLEEPSNQGHAFIVINPEMMMPLADFKTRVDEMIAEIKSAPLAPDREEIFLPGEMVWERRKKALVEGMLLPVDVIESLNGLAKDLCMAI